MVASSHRWPTHLPGRPETWFRLAHLARTYGLSAAERQVLFFAGVYVKEKWLLTERHLRFLIRSLLRLLQRLVADSRDEETLASGFILGWHLLKEHTNLTEIHYELGVLLKVGGSLEGLNSALHDALENWPRLMPLSPGDAIASPETIHAVCARCGHAWSWKGIRSVSTQRCVHCGAKPSRGWRFTAQGIETFMFRDTP